MWWFELVFICGILQGKIIKSNVIHITETFPSNNSEEDRLRYDFHNKHVWQDNISSNEKEKTGISNTITQSQKVLSYKNNNNINLGDPIKSNHSKVLIENKFKNIAYNISEVFIRNRRDIFIRNFKHRKYKPKRYNTYEEDNTGQTGEDDDTGETGEDDDTGETGETEEEGNTKSNEGTEEEKFILLKRQTLKQNCPSDGIFPDLNSCKYFHYCWEGKNYYFRCQSKSAVYNPQKQICNKISKKNKCFQFDCDNRYNRNVSYSGDKSIYASCYKNKPKEIFRCPDSLIYYERIQECLVKCDAKLVKDPKDCTRYYKCKTYDPDSPPKPYRCPLNTRFDERIKKCTYRELLKCTKINPVDVTSSLNTGYSSSSTNRSYNLFKASSTPTLNTVFKDQNFSSLLPTQLTNNTFLKEKPYQTEQLKENKLHSNTKFLAPQTTKMINININISNEIVVSPVITSTLAWYLQPNYTTSFMPDIKKQQNGSLADFNTIQSNLNSNILKAENTNRSKIENSYDALRLSYGSLSTTNSLYNTYYNGSSIFPKVYKTESPTKTSLNKPSEGPTTEYIGSVGSFGLDDDNSAMYTTISPLYNNTYYKNIKINEQKPKPNIQDQLTSNPQKFNHGYNERVLKQKGTQSITPTISAMLDVTNKYITTSSNCTKFYNKIMNSKGSILSSNYFTTNSFQGTEEASVPQSNTEWTVLPNERSKDQEFSISSKDKTEVINTLSSPKNIFELKPSDIEKENITSTKIFKENIQGNSTLYPSKSSYKEIIDSENEKTSQIIENFKSFPLPISGVTTAMISSTEILPFSKSNTKEEITLVGQISMISNQSVVDGANTIHKYLNSTTISVLRYDHSPFVSESPENINDYQSRPDIEHTTHPSILFKLNNNSIEYLLTNNKSSISSIKEMGIYNSDYNYIDGVVNSTMPLLTTTIFNKLFPKLLQTNYKNSNENTEATTLKNKNKSKYFSTSVTPEFMENETFVGFLGKSSTSETTQSIGENGTANRDSLLNVYSINGLGDIFKTEEEERSELPNYGDNEESKGRQYISSFEEMKLTTNEVISLLKSSVTPSYSELMENDALAGYKEKSFITKVEDENTTETGDRGTLVKVDSINILKTQTAENDPSELPDQGDNEVSIDHPYINSYEKWGASNVPTNEVVSLKSSVTPTTSYSELMEDKKLAGGTVWSSTSEKPTSLKGLNFENGTVTAINFDATNTFGIAGGGNISVVTSHPQSTIFNFSGSHTLSTNKTHNHSLNNSQYFINTGLAGPNILLDHTSDDILNTDLNNELRKSISSTKNKSTSAKTLPLSDKYDSITFVSNSNKPSTLQQETNPRLPANSSLLKTDSFSKDAILQVTTFLVNSDSDMDIEPILKTEDQIEKDYLLSTIPDAESTKNFNETVLNSTFPGVSDSSSMDDYFYTQMMIPEDDGSTTEHHLDIKVPKETNMSDVQVFNLVTPVEMVTRETTTLDKSVGNPIQSYSYKALPSHVVQPDTKENSTQIISESLLIPTAPLTESNIVNLFHTPNIYIPIIKSNSDSIITKENTVVINATNFTLLITKEVNELDIKVPKEECNNAQATSTESSTTILAHDEIYINPSRSTSIQNEITSFDYKNFSWNDEAKEWDPTNEDTSFVPNKTDNTLHLIPSTLQNVPSDSNNFVKDRSNIDNSTDVNNLAISESTDKISVDSIDHYENIVTDTSSSRINEIILNNLENSYSVPLGGIIDQNSTFKTNMSDVNSIKNKDRFHSVTYNNFTDKMGNMSSLSFKDSVLEVDFEHGNVSTTVHPLLNTSMSKNETMKITEASITTEKATVPIPSSIGDYFIVTTVPTHFELAKNYSQSANIPIMTSKASLEDFNKHNYENVSEIDFLTVTTDSDHTVIKNITFPHVNSTKNPVTAITLPLSNNFTNNPGKPNNRSLILPSFEGNSSTVKTQKANNGSNADVSIDINSKKDDSIDINSKTKRNDIVNPSIIQSSNIYSISPSFKGNSSTVAIYEANNESYTDIPDLNVITNKEPIILNHNKNSNIFNAGTLSDNSNNFNTVGHVLSDVSFSTEFVEDSTDDNLEILRYDVSLITNSTIDSQNIDAIYDGDTDESTTNLYSTTMELTSNYSVNSIVSDPSQIEFQFRISNEISFVSLNSTRDGPVLRGDMDSDRQSNSGHTVPGTKGFDTTPTVTTLKALDQNNVTSEDLKNSVISVYSDVIADSVTQFVPHAFTNGSHSLTNSSLTTISDYAVYDYSDVTNENKNTLHKISDAPLEKEVIEEVVSFHPDETINDEFTAVTDKIATTAFYVNIDFVNRTVSEIFNNRLNSSTVGNIESRLYEKDNVKVSEILSSTSYPASSTDLKNNGSEHKGTMLDKDQINILAITNRTESKVPIFDNFPIVNIETVSSSGSETHAQEEYISPNGTKSSSDLSSNNKETNSSTDFENIYKTSGLLVNTIINVTSQKVGPEIVLTTSIAHILDNFNTTAVYQFNDFSNDEPGKIGSQMEIPTLFEEDITTPVYGADDSYKESATKTVGTSPVLYSLPILFSNIYSNFSTDEPAEIGLNNPETQTQDGYTMSAYGARPSNDLSSSSKENLSSMVFENMYKTSHQSALPAYITVTTEKVDPKIDLATSKENILDRFNNTDVYQFSSFSTDGPKKLDTKLVRPSVIDEDITTPLYGIDDYSYIELATKTVASHESSTDSSSPLINNIYSNFTESLTDSSLKTSNYNPINCTSNMELQVSSEDSVFSTNDPVKGGLSSNTERTVFFNTDSLSVESSSEDIYYSHYINHIQTPLSSTTQESKASENSLDTSVVKGYTMTEGVLETDLLHEQYQNVVTSTEKLPEVVDETTKAMGRSEVGVWENQKVSYTCNISDVTDALPHVNSNISESTHHMDYHNAIPHDSKPLINVSLTHDDVSSYTSVSIQFDNIQKPSEDPYPTGLKNNTHVLPKSESRTNYTENNRFILDSITTTLHSTTTTTRSTHPTMTKPYTRPTVDPRPQVISKISNER